MHLKNSESILAIHLGNSKKFLGSTEESETQ